MIIVLVGAPGAGKGTQAALLAEELGCRVISTGDTLRRHIKLGSNIGQQAKQFMESGRLVPDSVLLGVLVDELETCDTKNSLILLDGFPRTLTQAESLEKSLQGCGLCALYVKVDQETLIARLSGRRVCDECGLSFHLDSNPPRKSGSCDRCSGGLVVRADDDVEKVLVRLKIFEELTSPVLEFYAERNLLWTIDGELEPKAVFEQVKSAVASMA